MPHCPFLNSHPEFRRFSARCAVFLIALPPLCTSRARAEPLPQAVSAYNSYVAAVEARLVTQHQSQNTFLAGQAFQPEIASRLRSGESILEELTPSTANLPGALLHHWRGTAFAPGATAADFERMLRDFNAYPQRFAPQVLKARVLSERDGHLLATMRVRQKHVLTVVLDSTYDIAFGRLDAGDGYSSSRSTAVYEVDSPGTVHEHQLSASQEHGFLWRLNTYWTYEERDGGLYIQLESVSLSRSIPAGLGWVLGPFVESVPRESLEFTLRSACKAVRK
jgi:hypothetical protein